MIVIQPVVNMRKNPSEKSEVVSQALFAEKVAFFQEEGKWSFISTPDGYLGWVLSESFISVEELTFTIRCRPEWCLNIPDIKFYEEAESLKINMRKITEYNPK